jgi:osmoprotectant transport system permease protein
MKRVAILLCVLLVTPRAEATAPVRQLNVGSKSFPESLILGEMVAQLAKSPSVEPRHKETKGLGGTRVLWEALRKGDIDVYPEYTGTISEEILSGKGGRGEDDIRKALAAFDIRMSQPLGFNNTYVIAMKEEAAARLDIRTISNLRQHPELRFGFSNEFLQRGDGWPSLKRAYDLPQRDVRGMEHTLGFLALENGDIDVMELYSTEGKIRRHRLSLLDDDRKHFPDYHAVLLYRADLQARMPEAVQSFLRLEGTIREPDMRELNARVELDHEREARVAADFLAERLAVQTAPELDSAVDRILAQTGRHLLLVIVSLTAAVVVAVPLGVIAARRPKTGQAVLGVASLVQTIPSLALLVLLMSVPFLGLGFWTAVVALFLYSLLPIIRNTYAGLHDIAPSLRESAAALGLPPLARLRLVELPIAARSILAGIKTSAVINVGTATLGGLIGAGGYGQAIFTGLTLQNTTMVLEGAVPAAVMALLVQGIFELAERVVVPRGLRLHAAA